MTENSLQENKLSTQDLLRKSTIIDILQFFTKSSIAPPAEKGECQKQGWKNHDF